MFTFPEFTEDGSKNRITRTLGKLSRKQYTFHALGRNGVRQCRECGDLQSEEIKQKCHVVGHGECVRDGSVH